jgi:signal transduction histidine kinase
LSCKDFEGLIFLNIKDITSIIKGLQKINDQVCLTAIENNFSHELMTPLNPIVSSSSMLKSRLLAAFKGKE